MIVIDSYNKIITVIKNYIKTILMHNTINFFFNIKKILTTYLYTYIFIDFDWDLSCIPRPKLRFVCWTLTPPSLSYNTCVIGGRLGAVIITRNVKHGGLCTSKCMGFSFAALLNCKTTENLIQYPLYMHNNSGPSPV